MKNRMLESLALVALSLASAAAMAGAPDTVRVDYYHGGNAEGEMFSLHRVVIEPVPWPGNADKPIDTLGLGHFLFQVEDPESGEVLYSRGFSSIFQEWQHTGEAREMNRTFHESVRFPRPDKPVLLRIMKRDENQAFASAWTATIDVDDMLTVREHAPAPAPVLDIHVSGEPAGKVDIAILGDGYTADEAAKFEADARRLTEYLFSVEPFKSRSGDFNVRAISPPATRSGTNRPSNRNGCAQLGHGAAGGEFTACTQLLSPVARSDWGKLPLKCEQAWGTVGMLYRRLMKNPGHRSGRH